MKKYDVIVVGGGHAGYEAAWAAANMGAEVLLLTMNLETVAQASCNPAIGGVGKGQIVREIDALGGLMGKGADAVALQLRMLNTRKGEAVQAPRAQIDRAEYRVWIQKMLQSRERIHIKQATVTEILVEKGVCKGVKSSAGTLHEAECTILAPGTFLRGCIHIGDSCSAGGRAGELSSVELAQQLESLGFVRGRLKTGTSPRVSGRSIDWQKFFPQWGDEPPPLFSRTSPQRSLEQMPCYIGYTNSATHKVVADNLQLSSLYGGRIKGVGVRYCPSIEDKIVKFPQKDAHQIFLEPDGRFTDEVYINGLSTSLPEQIQLEFLRTIPGMEEVQIVRPGYAIEYDFFPPTQLKYTLETKKIRRLFFAGQINGTTGYEEAAAQGLVAGVNAVLLQRGEPPFILGRHEAYIGVLIDDLVTKGVQEPYRMFTARAEYRLLLRFENAYFRLLPYAERFGLIKRGEAEQIKEEEAMVHSQVKRLKETPCSAKTLSFLGQSQKVSLADALKRLSYKKVVELEGKQLLDNKIKEHCIAQIKYEDYIKRGLQEVERLRRLQECRIPEDLDYESIKGLSIEAKEKLSKLKPKTLKDAFSVPGVKFTDIMLLSTYLRKNGRG